MKKNLVLLTGIVFVLTILLAAGCNRGTNKEGSVEAGDEALETRDPTKVDIFLMESLDSGTMHLFIYDSKKPDCGVIDDHFIVVKGGYTIKWKNAHGSNIDDIIHIRAVGGDGKFLGVAPKFDKSEIGTLESFQNGIPKLVLPDTIHSDTVIKYEIKFTVKKDTFIIDPYLKIPKQL